MTSTRIDPTDTIVCPLGHRCECCGIEIDDLTVVTSTTAAGTLCITACRACGTAIRRGAPVPVAPATADRLIRQHAQHLGADGSAWGYSDSVWVSSQTRGHGDA